MSVAATGLADRLDRWAGAVGIDPCLLPSPWDLEALCFDRLEPCRPGAGVRRLAAWEDRHGYRLPHGLRAWLLVSDGFFLDVPLIHPLSAIGPMIPFARVPDLVVQPESWFEIGNPGEETVCVDLAYTWPGGDCPLFASGDDERKQPPRIIAPSFETWFLGVLQGGGRQYWLDPAFRPLGDPWREHRLRAPAPPLPDRLRRLVPRVRRLMRLGADERRIATTLGITRLDVEAIFRHLQHVPIDYAEP